MIGAHLKNRNRNEEGYILLLAVLISSIILAISLGVYSIGLKQFVLTSFMRDSQKALTAANRGIECFMYWDGLFRDNGLQDANGNGTTNTLFPQPLNATDPSSGLAAPYWKPLNADTATCAGLQIDSPSRYWGSDPSFAWGTGPYVTTVGSNSGILTKFNLQFLDGSAVNVWVFRSVNKTQIMSYGYNTTDESNIRRTMRLVEVDASI